MNRTSVVAALAAGTILSVLAADASAMYHPTLGRWVSRDPIGYTDRFNIYEYGAGAPAGCTDPHGFVAQPASGAKFPNADAHGIAPWGEGKMSTPLHKSRVANRPCFKSTYRCQGQGRVSGEGEQQRLHIMAPWQLFVFDIRQTPDCFCCPDGKNGEPQLRQYVRHADYTPGKGWGSWDEWDPDMAFPSALSAEQVKARQDSNQLGPLMEQDEGSGLYGMHAYPEGNAGGQWQPNRVEYSHSLGDFAGKHTGTYSWYDIPGFHQERAILTSALHEEWGMNPQYLWHFYVEVWRHCTADPSGDAMVDRAHFVIGIAIRKEDPAKIAMTGHKEPLWLGK